uniref:RING-type E3 ubiquitin transferase n=1 Tax=Lepeophtheirus salmonis TaxID=72036 RepID=C1BT84_LEPSM|nr:RING finger protein 168 [Lepeophtheirus salmonis]
MPNTSKVRIKKPPLNTECPACLSKPNDPIRLPCNHIICLTCYKRNIELTSLHCPLCKRRLSNWSRSINTNGGPKVDPVVKRWLMTQKPQTSKRKRVSKVSSTSSDSIKKDFEQEILHFRNKENTNHDEDNPDEIASMFSTDIEEQKQIEQRLLREREDARIALALNNSFRGVVDRSKNSPDAYSLRSKRMA